MYTVFKFVYADARDKKDKIDVAHDHRAGYADDLYDAADLMNEVVTEGNLFPTLPEDRGRIVEFELWASSVDLADADDADEDDLMGSLLRKVSIEY